MRAVAEQPSAVSGETSPLLDARSDLAKFQSGARSISNMVVLPEGGRTRRPGTRFVGTLKNEALPCALVPFEAGDGDSYVQCINDQVMRMFKSAGVVIGSTGSALEVAVPFTTASLPTLRWTQSLDTMLFAWSGTPQLLVRASDINWSITAYPNTNGPVKVRNADKTKTIQSSGETGIVTLTASVPLFEPGHVGSIWRIDESVTADIRVWRAAVTYVSNMYIRYQGRIYEVVLGGDSGDVGPQHDEGDYRTGSGSDVAGAVLRFTCYDHGFVRITSVPANPSTTCTALVLQRLAPSIVSYGAYRWSEGAWCEKNGWPNVVTIVDQSVLWGRRNEIWMSETTDIYSFEESTTDDSALSFRLFAPDGKAVNFRWAMNAGSLLLGASAGEWVVRGPNSYDRITAQNSRGFLQSSEGSSEHQPVSIAGGAVFIGRSRDRLNFAKFDFLSERIEIQEFTTFSRHMLKAGAMQLAWQSDPHRILWIRMGDGTLTAVTLRPEQEVAGWHRHHLPGAFIEQICCIQSADGGQTELWLQTRRTINGQTRRFIEVMQPFFQAVDDAAPTSEGAWFLDCALQYTGPATRTLSGMAHLAGQSVKVHCPQGSFGPLTVSATGTVALPVDVTDAVCGLPIPWKTTSLPIDIATQLGPSKGRLKSAHRLVLHMHQSGGGTVMVNSGPATDIQHGGGNVFNAAYALTTGVVSLAVDAITAREITITVFGDDPLPFTLLSTSADLDILAGTNA